jgi:hypothetical protein
MNFRVVLAAFGLLFFQKTISAQEGIVIVEKVVFFADAPENGINETEFINKYLPQTCQLLQNGNSTWSTQANWATPMSANGPTELFYIRIHKRKCLFFKGERVADIPVVKRGKSAFLMAKACDGYDYAIKKQDWNLVDTQLVNLKFNTGFNCQFQIWETKFKVITTNSFRVRIYRK